jgi:hypothetical protein
MITEEECLLLHLPPHFNLIDNYVKIQLDIYEESFVQLVKKECKAIKNYFGKYQIDRLIASKIEGQSVSKCIYGTMTGSCNSIDVANFILNELDTLIVANKPVDYVDSFNVYNRSYESLMTPLEVYIMPTDKEEVIAVEEEEGGELVFPDSYYARISEVVNWITNEN